MNKFNVDNFYRCINKLEFCVLNVCVCKWIIIDNNV